MTAPQAVRRSLPRIWAAKVAFGSALAMLGTAHTWWNLRRLRVPPRVSGSTDEKVSVLLPLRDEAHRVKPCLTALGGQEFDELLILDDASSDDTAAVVQATIGHDPRVRIIRGEGEPPLGWLGKPWACQRLAEAATGDVLVFIDADVVLDDAGISRSVALLRQAGLSVVCPYPRQLTAGLLGRLVQPLLQWSWLTTLPLGIAETSRRPSLTAGNGQLLLADSHVYWRAGGHAAVRSDVVEDVALVRAIKLVGGRGGVADGTTIAECRMYDSDAELVAGYTKSLWSAFGSPTGAGFAMAALMLAYVVPPAAALASRRPKLRALGLLGYGAAVAGRVLVARRTRGRAFPDPLSHPVSILALVALTTDSLRRHRAGTLRWRGRVVN